MNSILYVYAMTCDSGFAPCVKDSLLTLACCKGGKKGGMRTAIYHDFEAHKKDGTEIWVLGLCGKGLAKGREMEYSPIYLAKVTGVIPMTEYYGPNSAKYQGREDHKAYQLVGDKLEPTEDNPHKDSADTIAKDIGGKYVVLSKDFIYWGEACGQVTRQDLVAQLKEKANGIFCSDGGKKGIDQHYRDYIVCRDFEGTEDLLKCCRQKAPKQQAAPLSPKYTFHEDENNDIEITVCHSCHESTPRSDIPIQ